MVGIPQISQCLRACVSLVHHPGPELTGAATGAGQLGIQDITHDDSGTGGITLHKTGVLWPENIFCVVYDDWEAVLDVKDLVPTSCYMIFMLVKSMKSHRLSPDLLQHATRCN